MASVLAPKLAPNSLMDLEKDFPLQYSIEFACSESTLVEIVEKVASFTSKVYATFSRLSNEERVQFQTKKFWIKELNKFPSENECQEFEERLKQEIITVFSQRGDYLSVNLSTDYSPETTLCKVAKPIFGQKYELGFLFPYKTCTRISLEEKRTKLTLNMDFKKP
jgi:hypothetical protein